MGTKTITIMDDAYDILKKNKKDGKSFSEAIRDMNKNMQKKGDIMELAGAWKGMPDKVIEQMKKDIENGRKKSPRDIW